MISGFSLDPKLVGRDKEINHLVKQLETALSGKGSVVFVGGEAGVGKTRLVNEFLKIAEEKAEVEVLSGWCLSEAAIPYFPFIEAFNQYVSKLVDHEAKSSISDSLGIIGWLRGTDKVLRPEKREYELSPQIEKDRTFDAVARVFLDLTKNESHILFIDNLQWADQLSLAMIHYLAKKCRNSRLLIIGAYRTEDIGQVQDSVHPLVDTMFSLSREGLLSKMELNRLDRSDFPELLQSIFRSELSPTFVEKLYDETEGNPLFIIETLNLLIEENFLVEKDGKWELLASLESIGIPSRVQDVILRRVSKLDRDQRKILALAAVYGRSFSPEIISRALSMSLVYVYESFVEIEQRHKLIKSTDSFFEFTHLKIREVFYDNIQSGLKKMYHLQTANTLEQVLSEKISNGYLAAVAHHYIEGNSPEKAFKYLIELGEQARALYANREAVDYLTKALEIAEQHLSLATSESLFRIYKTRGQAIRPLLLDAKLPLDVKNDFTRMLKEAESIGDMKTLAEAYLVMGNAYNPYFDESEESLKYLLPGLELSRKVGDKNLETRFLLSLASIDLLSLDKIDEGLKKLEEASIISKETGNKTTESGSLRYLGTHYKDSGDFLLAKEKFVSAIESAIIANMDPHSMVWRYFMMSIVLAELGEYDDALIYGKKGLEIGNEYELVSVSWVLNTIGWIYYHLGSWELAIKYCDDCLEYAKKSDRKMAMGGVPYSLSVLGRIHLELRNYDKAEEYLEEAYKLQYLHTSTREYPRLMSIIELSLCELKFAKSQGSQILEKLDEIIAKLEKARFKKYLSQSLALKAEVLAAEGNLDEAYRLMEEALHHTQAMNSPYLSWRTHYALGGIYSRNNEPQKAIEQYKVVKELFEETASKIRDQSLKNSLLSKRIYQDVCARIIL